MCRARFCVRTSPRAAEEAGGLRSGDLLEQFHDIDQTNLMRRSPQSIAPAGPPRGIHQAGISQNQQHFVQLVRRNFGGLGEISPEYGLPGFSRQMGEGSQRVL